MNAFMITIGTVLALIMGNFLLGVIISIKVGDFDIQKLPQFLRTGILYYVGSLLVLAGTACLAGNYSTIIWSIFAAAAVAVASKYIAEIKEKVLQIFGVLEITATVNVDEVNNDLVIQIKKAINDVIKKTTSA